MIKRRLSHETNAHRLPAAGRTDPVPATRIPTPASARETRTILKNGDFSASEKYWNFWTQDPANGKSKLVKDGGKDGSAGMKITNSQAVASSLGQFAN